MGRDIGKEGERYFGVLCSNAGLTANQSLEKDETGWDYLVEFPCTKDHSLPMDQQPSPIECKLQVKSTEKRDKKLQVKVSTLHRLVISHYPAFFIFFEYGPSHYPENAYLLHINEELIGKVIKRVRTLESQGKKDELNKRTITIHYDDSLNIGEITGKNLKAKIASYIPNGLNEYTKTKLSLLESLGYEDPAIKMNITFSSENGNVLEDVTDLFLGLKDEVSVKKIEAFTKRFGIELPDNKLSGVSGKLSLPDLQPSFSGSLFFKEDELSPPIEFDAQVFIPFSALNLSNEDLKFRIVTDHFEFILSGGTAKFTFSWSSKVDQEIECFRKHAWLFLKLERGGKLFIGLERDGEAFNLGTTHLDKMELGDYSTISSLADKSIYVCKHFEVNLKRVKVTTDLLFTYREGIELLYGLITSDPKHFKLIGPASKEANGEVLKTSLIFGLKTRIGNACFCIASAFIINKSEFLKYEDKFILIADEIRLSKMRFGSVNEISNLDLNEVKESFARELERDGYSVEFHENN